MKILSVNAGSSSLKFQLYEMPEEKVLISGLMERIGVGNSFYTIKVNGEKIKKEVELNNHEEAFETLVKELEENNVVESLDEIEGIGAAKKKALLENFGSVERIKNADIEELIKVKGITKDLAERIKKYNY